MKEAIARINEKYKAFVAAPRLNRFRLYRVFRKTAGMYVRGHIGRSAGAMSYFLTISIFPMLICAVALLSTINIADSEGYILPELAQIIPLQAFEPIRDFLGYVEKATSPVMISLGVLVMLTSSSAAVRAFSSICGDLQGKRRFSGSVTYILAFLVSALFIVGIYLSGVIMVAGDWLMNWLDAKFGVHYLTQLWKSLRFLLMFLILAGIYFGMYCFSAPKGDRHRIRLIGATAASVATVIVSVIFSKMISASVKYTVVYGSLASFVILMTWLYMLSLIVIMGNVLNIAIVRSKDLYDYR
jgi:YihY family inner membrane protein